MKNERLEASVKAAALVALALFLYSLLFNGSLAFYINQQFAGLTLLAALALLLVAASYRYRPAHAHAGHGHEVPRWGLLLAFLPVALGLLVPPRPLGASAMAGRAISAGALASAPSPGTGAAPMPMPEPERGILEWLVAFGQEQDPAAFTGQEAHVIGFVYRDERFPADTFMVSRFYVSCCVADATAIGLIVRWPETAALELDEWVEVRGCFQPGEFLGQQIPILAAETITSTVPPAQPYLY